VAPVRKIDIDECLFDRLVVWVHRHSDRGASVWTHYLNHLVVSEASENLQTCSVRDCGRVEEDSKRTRFGVGREGEPLAMAREPRMFDTPDQAGCP
jgi:hypothetical protein